LNPVDEDQRTPLERRIAKSMLDEPGAGKPLSRRARQTKRSVESYLKGGVMPRFMERLREIDNGIESQRRLLARAHRLLAAEVDRDAAEFERRWRAYAQSQRWRFADLNVLIREHNEWYPVERNLPLDPRTRDYVKPAGRSYRRTELDPEWVLEQFPPVLPEREADEDAA
jgi:hypothetical protein